ncbi:antitoxin [Methylomagnum ishizawai]|uniref:antitoxin n=1 Tax=Methylomagnum ishizawai TaxID=1760988 RepID=UPI001C31F415|nr:hypothetical protein [Methylomagnum ishizawai]BBL76914.1 hypothetical protein MishRS11D_40120 [Methylomagnum ishizawai]
MQAIELSATITQNHEIHLKLPASVKASQAKIIVMYENNTCSEASPSSQKWDKFFATESVFDDDFLAERDNTTPQERELS